jgi:hypothetical protein
MMQIFIFLSAICIASLSMINMTVEGGVCVGADLTPGANRQKLDFFNKE